MPDTNQPVQWRADRTADADSAPAPSMLQAMGRGLVGRCPVCGVGHVFNGYLRVVPECSHCGTPLGQVRADDAPPYFTIFIVGHLTVPLIFKIDHAYAPSLWLQAAIWLPVVALMCLVLLRPVKGATVGLMLKLGFLKQST